MEPIRNKRRNLISKSMLSMSLHRATKPSSAALQPYIGKPSKPSPVNKPKPGPPSMGTGFMIVNQDQVFSQQAPKVGFVAVTDRSRDSYDAKLESFYGAEDEAVDAKAAKYISRLHESFRLER
ncbi:hypothetical protein CASFOL_003523 [Castilleja foliolosa]|uniref:Uncharacterized protein n=1 Tax=Castilleja foliolosa TaxID=1961234 RepID=A0ABD3EJA1_9LAMI